MIICPACGTGNGADAAYCARCARRLDDTARRQVDAVRTSAAVAQATRIRWTAIGVVTVALALFVALIVIGLLLLVH